MPTYILKNRETGERQEVFISIAEMKKRTDPETGEYDQVMQNPMVVSHVDSILGKTNSDYKDLLKKIDKDAGRHSKVHY